MSSDERQVVRAALTRFHKLRSQRAFIHKTFYVTSEYRVLGFIDKEYKRVDL